jgi:hypothetical protein
LFLVPASTIVAIAVSVLLTIVIGTFGGFVIRQRMRKQRENDQRHDKEHSHKGRENQQSVEAKGGYELPMHEHRIKSNHILKTSPTQQRSQQKSHHDKAVTRNVERSNDGHTILQENVRGKCFESLHEYTYITNLSQIANRQTEQTDGDYEIPLNEYHNSSDCSRPYGSLNPSDEVYYSEI